MNIENYYFHAIRPYKMFNKKERCYDTDFNDESCQILESIIIHKSIMCRKSLSTIYNIEELFNESRTNWNGMNAVSTCIYPTKIKKCYLIDEESYNYYKDESAFYEWVYNGYLTLLIKPEITKLLNYDDDYPPFHQTDEVRFFGDIPLDYVAGILYIGNYNKLVEAVKVVLSKCDLNLPLINLKRDNLNGINKVKTKIYGSN